GTRIAVKLEIAVTGAPVRSSTILEMTEDGTTFKELKVLSALRRQHGQGVSETLTFEYPFTTEKPLRVRALVSDAAGNFGVSPLSPVLVGPGTNIQPGPYRKGDSKAPIY